LKKTSREGAKARRENGEKLAVGSWQLAEEWKRGLQNHAEALRRGGKRKRETTDNRFSPRALWLCVSKICENLRESAAPSGFSGTTKTQRREDRAEEVSRGSSSS